MTPQRSLTEARPLPDLRQAWPVNGLRKGLPGDGFREKIQNRHRRVMFVVNIMLVPQAFACIPHDLAHMFEQLNLSRALRAQMHQVMATSDGAHLQKLH